MNVHGDWGTGSRPLVFQGLNGGTGFANTQHMTRNWNSLVLALVCALSSVACAFDSENTGEEVCSKCDSPDVVESGTVVGHIRLEDGARVSEGEVIDLLIDDEIAFSTNTEERGGFRFFVPGGTYHLRVSVNGEWVSRMKQGESLVEAKIAVFRDDVSIYHWVVKYDEDGGYLARE